MSCSPSTPRDPHRRWFRLFRRYLALDLSPARQLLLSIEQLEERCVPTAQAFSVTINDPSGLFGPYPLLKADVTAAASILSSEIDGLGTLQIEVVPDSSGGNGTERAGGTAAAVTAVGTFNGKALVETGTVTKSQTGTDPNATGPDIILSLDTGSYLPTLFFDPSGAARTGTVPAGKTDFISVALHEMIHALGMEGYRNIGNPGFGGVSGNYLTTFDSLSVMGAGGDPNIMYFTGSHAEAVYGGAVPLTSEAAGYSENWYHVANPAGEPGSQLVNDLMNGIVFEPGTRYAPSALDLGILADLGYDTHAAAAGASAASTTAPAPAPAALTVAELGAYRPSDGSWTLDSNGTLGFQSGQPPVGDRVIQGFSGASSSVIPVSGDWTGTGTSKIGDFENGTWHLDLTDNGKLDPGDTFTFGMAGDVPVPGNYFGDGIRLAVFRSLSNGAGEFIISDKTWRTDAVIGVAETFDYGAAGDRVVVGDWNGAGLTEVGVFRAATAFGAPGAAVFSLDIANHHAFDSSNKVFIFGTFTDGVVIGDWNGSGTDKVGVYRDASSMEAPGTAVFSLDTTGDLRFDSSSEVFLYGTVSDKYVTGKWAKVTASAAASAALLPDPTARASYLAIP